MIKMCRGAEWENEGGVKGFSVLWYVIKTVYGWLFEKYQFSSLRFLSWYIIIVMLSTVIQRDRIYIFDLFISLEK